MNSFNHETDEAKTQSVLAYIENHICIHKFEYLNNEAAHQFKSLGEMLQNDNRLDAGARRIVRLEIMKKYGLLEVEAVNLLNGYHLEDYADKYQTYKKCDEYRTIVFSYLKQMTLPDTLHDKQVKLLSELFMERKGDKKLIGLELCEDMELGIFEILDEILDCKEKEKQKRCFTQKMSRI